MSKKKIAFPKTDQYKEYTDFCEEFIEQHGDQS
jgi:hypothetical protein